MRYACTVCSKVSELRLCEQHRSTRTKTGKPTPQERGYGKTYVHNRNQLLSTKPTCKYCGQEPATIAHHNPSRRTLVAMQVTDPDDLAFLEPICKACHNRETSRGR